MVRLAQRSGIFLGRPATRAVEEDNCQYSVSLYYNVTTLTRTEKHNVVCTTDATSHLTWKSCSGSIYHLKGPRKVSTHKWDTAAMSLLSPVRTRSFDEACEASLFKCIFFRTSSCSLRCDTTFSQLPQLPLSFPLSLLLLLLPGGFAAPDGARLVALAACS